MAQKRKAGSSAWGTRSCLAATASLHGLSVSPLSPPLAPTISSGLKYPKHATTPGVPPSAPSTCCFSVWSIPLAIFLPKQTSCRSSTSAKLSFPRPQFSLLFNGDSILILTSLGMWWQQMHVGRKALWKGVRDGRREESGLSLFPGEAQGGSGLSPGGLGSH